MANTVSPGLTENIVEVQVIVVPLTVNAGEAPAETKT